MRVRKFQTLRQNLRGARVVAQRRGLKYFGYLLTGVAWPQTLYRVGWGPNASALGRRVFDRAGKWAGEQVAPAAAREAGLLIGLGQVGASSTAAEDAEDVMARAHAAGIGGVRHALDRVVRIPGSRARFAAMPGVRRYATSSAWFLAERDADLRAFNERFGRSLLTEADTRRTLGRLKANVPPGYRDYAPIDFGGGLTIGQVASTDSGTGRWDFFNGAIVGPIVAGKRVLDLGSNNGSMPLMMLRAGASEVVAIERTPQIAEFARFNARVLAWRDMRPYAMEVLDGDMRLFLTSDLGRFDVVTAFCSLYYLPEADMARIIAKAAAMGATLVLQANEAIDNLPARAAILERLMVSNGYPHVRVHAPSGFARPLLVATAPTAVASGDRAFAARA